MKVFIMPCCRKMREKEEQVLGELGISREETFVSEE